jgi:23S rRNA (uracil1939-C5)-methyltransferase
MAIRTGDIVKLEIETIAFGGAGIGRAENLVVFVPFTAKGDEAEVEIREAKKRYLRGRLRKLIVPSPDRVDPPCPYFRRCGGCHYQHIEYATQVGMKRSQVIEAFERIGKFAEPPVEPALPSPVPYGYRGKAEFHVERMRDGTYRVGFMDVSGARLVDIERCAIMEESINEQLAILRQPMHAPLRVDRYVIWSLTGKGEEKHVVRIVKGRDILVPLEGFFQANTALTDTLVDAVIEFAGAGPDETMLDLYCGSGLFSLFLASACKKLVGIEIDGEAVDCARLNMERLGIENAVFHAGDVRDVLERETREGRAAADVVILDPPRTGCEREVLDLVIGLRPSRIVYVSCDPGTLARDARLLVDSGWNLVTVRPMDMFPQTKHIETVALFRRQGPGDRVQGAGEFEDS